MSYTHRGRRVFAPVTTSLPSNQLVVVHGPSGSGRSSFLLAITSRLRGVSGTLRFPALNEPAAPAAISSHRVRRARRRTTSIARVGTLVDLEPQLTVAESVTERCLADGISSTAGPHRLSHLAGHAEMDFDDHTLVADLPALQRTVLAVLLAMIRPPKLVVLDDADRDLDEADQAKLYQILSELAATGTTIVASTCDRSPIPTGTVTISLTNDPSHA